MKHRTWKASLAVLLLAALILSLAACSAPPVLEAEAPSPTAEIAEAAGAEDT